MAGAGAAQRVPELVLAGRAREKKKAAADAEAAAGGSVTWRARPQNETKSETKINTNHAIVKMNK